MQMEHCELTQKEFAVLCAGVGAKRVYGIPHIEKIFNMRKSESEIIEVEKSLESKGYIESDFDGNTSIKPDLIKIMETIAGYKKILCTDEKHKKNTAINKVYYIKDNAITKLQRSGDKYCISDITGENVCNEMENMISTVNSDISKAASSIPKNNYVQAKKEIDLLHTDKANNILSEFLDADTSSDILKCLSGEADFYLMIAADFTIKSDAVKNCLFFVIDGKIIKITPIINDVTDFVEIQYISKNELDSNVEECVKFVI